MDTGNVWLVTLSGHRSYSLQSIIVFAFILALGYVLIRRRANHSGGTRSPNRVATSPLKRGHRQPGASPDPLGHASKDGDPPDSAPGSS